MDTWEPFRRKWAAQAAAEADEKTIKELLAEQERQKRSVIWTPWNRKPRPLATLIEPRNTEHELMSDRKPHLCPACLGYTQIQAPPSMPSTACQPTLMACPTCKGAGVLWDPAPSDLEQRVAALEKVAHPQAVLADPELTEALKRYNEDRKMLRPSPFRGGPLDWFPLEPRDGFPHSGVCCSGRPLVFC